MDSPNIHRTNDTTLVLLRRKDCIYVASLPQHLSGSKQNLSDDIVVSFLPDRTLLLEAGRSVKVILTPKETAALYRYLHGNTRKFLSLGGGRCQEK